MQRIGALRERINLIQTRLQQTGTGDFQETSHDLGEVWAAIQPITSLPVEGEGWGQPCVQRYRVQVRLRESNFQRIRWRGKIYSLATAIIADSKRLWLEFIIIEQIS